MGIIRKGIFGLTCIGVSYGGYLSYKYPSIPFYQLPKEMKINELVNSYKSPDNEQYFANCDTFTKTVKLDAKYLENSTESKVIDKILVKFFKDKLNRDIEIEDNMIRKINNSVISKFNMNDKIVNFFETVSDYGWPYRSNSTTFAELYVELNPVINNNNQKIETYEATLYFSLADLYNKHDYDGKILPRFVLMFNRFRARNILQMGSRNVLQTLGSEN